MTSRPAFLALGDALRALTEGSDLQQTLVQVLDTCLDVHQGLAAGVMLSPRDGVVELLAATSHRSTEIELYQIQSADGPCLEVIRGGHAVVASGEQEVRARWGEVGPAIVRAGYQSVRAFPLRRREVVFGGLNIFGATLDPRPDEDALALGQAFADLVAVLVLASLGNGEEDVAARVREAIAGRTVIEQAKGVLAHRLGVGVARAYDALLERARATGATVTGEAARTIAEAQRSREDQ